VRRRRAVGEEGRPRAPLRAPDSSASSGPVQTSRAGCCFFWPHDLTGQAGRSPVVSSCWGSVRFVRRPPEGPTPGHSGRTVRTPARPCTSRAADPASAASGFGPANSPLFCGAGLDRDVGRGASSGPPHRTTVSPDNQPAGFSNAAHERP